MPDAWLVLFAGGLLLGAALPKPDAARRAWLAWLGGLSVVSACAGAAFAVGLPRAAEAPAFFLRIQAWLVGLTIAAAVAHVVTTWAAWARVGRVVAVAGFVVSVLAGSNLLHRAMLDAGDPVPIPPKALSMALQTVASAGAAAVPGVALALALFPLLGVTSPEPSARAFRRLYRALLVTVACRTLLAVPAALAIATLVPLARPVDWGLAAVRWALGLVAVPLLAWLGFRRAAGGRAFAAAAVLLVGALCAANAEQIALVLVRRTGLPF